MKSQKRRFVFLLFLLGVTIILASARKIGLPLLVWNASSSIPLGLYRWTSGGIGIKNYVLFWPTKDFEELMAHRHYLPSHVPLIKVVSALPGQRVCVISDLIMIDDRIVAQHLIADDRARPMPHWDACRNLSPTEFFVLGTAPRSLDSRYFGPITKSQIIGKYVPLWTKTD